MRRAMERGWTATRNRELATVAPSINQLLKLCMFIYIYTCIYLLKTALQIFYCVPNICTHITARV